MLVRYQLGIFTEWSWAGNFSLTVRTVIDRDRRPDYVMDRFKPDRTAAALSNKSSPENITRDIPPNLKQFQILLPIRPRHYGLPYEG